MDMTDIRLFSFISLLAAWIACTNAVKTYSIVKRDYHINFDDWRQICEAKGKKLASVQSADEQKAVERVLHDVTDLPVLTGMTRRRHQKQQPFTTMDGKPISYTNWINDDELEIVVGEDCVFINSPGFSLGRWSVRECVAEAALCEIQEPNAAKNFTVVKSDTEKVSGDWKQLCENKGGKLASILSADEQKVAEVALKDVRTADHVLTGMVRFNYDIHHFTDIDGKLLNYTNWNDDEPKKDFGTDCVVLQTLNEHLGKWSLEECWMEVAVCETQSTL